jgi:tRNA threonylcarbamoyladenosine biosynthesis protein TsaB
VFILAFDTSSVCGSVAVLEGTNVLAQLRWELEGSHGELLTPAIEKVLFTSGVSIEEIQLIAIGHGPGSFTGVRVAVNAARAFSFARNTPIMTFDSLEILAAGVERKDLPVLALVNAQKNLLFAATYNWNGSFWEKAAPFSTITTDSVETVFDSIHSEHLCLGDGCLEFADLIPETKLKYWVRDPSQSDYPDAEVVGRLAFHSFGQSSGQTFGQRPTSVWNQVQALYIRASGAEETLAKNRANK